MKYTPVAHKKLLINTGTYIKFPGNHCLEYSEREIIGKCKIRVVITSTRIIGVGSGCTGLTAAATDIETATTRMLSPK